MNVGMGNINYLEIEASTVEKEHVTGQRPDVGCTLEHASSWAPHEVLAIKLQCGETCFRVSLGTTRTLQQKLSRYLFSFIEKHLIIFLLTKFIAKKQNPNGPYKEVKSEPERWFFWAFDVYVPVLVA